MDERPGGSAVRDASTRSSSRTSLAAGRIFPIKRVTVYREVIRQLEALILELALAPGTRIGSERELAGRFGVSRVAVREALRALEGMGKIEVRPNSGAYVANQTDDPVAVQLRAGREMDQSFIRDLVDLREAIETKIVELVIRDGGPALSSVEELLDEVKAEFGRASSHEGSLDLRFESALGRLCGNRLLARCQAAVHTLWVDTWLRLGLAPGDRTALHAEHVAILRAIRGGNAERAVALMREHVHVRPNEAG